MNGELAQLVCLATYGTAWLTGDGAAEPPDLAQNSTFQFVGALAFVNGRTGRSQSTVRDWLLELRQRKVRRLWLVLPDPKPRPGPGGPIDEHLLVGFVNSGAWSLLAVSESEATQWNRAWHGAFPDAADRRVWAVRYDGVPADPTPPSPVSVDAASLQLTRAVTRARDFSVRQQLDRWARVFERVLAGDSGPESYPDMLAPGHPEDARRLAITAGAAWVFGAMGSWNDEGFSDPQASAEYADVSRDLYASVLSALVASVDCPLPSFH